MTALFRLLFVVPFAYIVAVMAAGLTIAVGAMGGPDAPPSLFILALVLNTLTVGAVAVVPASIAILAAEMAALRSPFYYLAVGAGLGFAANQVAFYVGRAPFYDSRAFLYVAGGLVGAATYWLIAGMSAGAGITAGETGD